MKTIRNLIFICFLSINAHAQTVKFPEDFILRKDEVPAGFKARTITDEARQAGYTTNPGIITDSNLIDAIYDNVNRKAINNVLVALYAKPNSDQEVGLYVINYTSVTALEAETKKNKISAGDEVF
jgi:hypothetical protein